MNTTDGFVRRRQLTPPTVQRRPGGERPTLDSLAVPNRVAAPSLHDAPRLQPQLSRPAAATTVAAGNAPGLVQPRHTQLDIDDIVRAPVEPPKKPPRRHWWSLPFGRRREKKFDNVRAFSRRKLIKRIVIVLVLLLLALGGFMAWNVLHNTSRIFKGNVLNTFFGGNKPLKTDQFGRSNVLLFGTEADDPNHPGADLTDSVMVISLDQTKHDAFIFSVPRDLWVKIPNCPQLTQGKINSVYECSNGSMGNGNEMQGQQALASAVSGAFGIDIQYTMHVDYKVLRDSINALGGVDITIQSPDPRGILDRNFDWRCNYKCYLVKWPNGPAHLDGEHALWLAQARNDAGGYGLPRGNFDREENQRKILLAAKVKATSIGFLANPVAVTNLLNSLGDNVRTNISTDEVKTFIDVLKNTDSKNILSVSLIDSSPSPFTTTTGPDGSSIVRPVKGLYDYSDLSTLVKVYLSGNGALLNEKATIDVLNATGIAGQAQSQADTLSAQGMTIGVVGNAPAGDYGKVKIYDLTKGDKPATKQKLEQTYGVTATLGPLPATLHSTASFVIVIGQALSNPGSPNTPTSGASAGTPSNDSGGTGSSGVTLQVDNSAASGQ